MRPIETKKYEELQIDHKTAMVLYTPWAPSVLKKANDKTIEDDKLYFIRADNQPKRKPFKLVDDNLHFSVSFIIGNDIKASSESFGDAC